MSYKVGKWCLMLAGSALALSMASRAASADCPVTYGQLKTAVTDANAADKTGFDNYSWAVVVNRAGLVCAVAFGGPNTTSQWLDSRQIAAAKAFTANGLSLDVGAGGTTALSTANLYQFVQSANRNIANPLFGLNAGNPLDSRKAYAGSYATFGTPSDPMLGSRVGGTITFGGGLALYQGGNVVGGIGISGDTACADHSVAWRIRTDLGLAVPGLVDKLTFAPKLGDMTAGHPHCPNDTATQGTTN